MSQLIIYGDIHGCYNELVALRNKIKPNMGDTEICVGDIITKGKQSIKTLRYIQQHDIQSVLGNHEDKLLRYLQHEKSAKQNPITLDADEQDIISQLNQEDIDYLSNMPLFKRFDDITVLHGGLQNHHNLSKLSKHAKSKILRMRYLDKNGDFITYGQEDTESIFWADKYDGNQGFVVYGHQKFSEIKISKNALGIDTGCVYGDSLSAVVFEDSGCKNFSIHQVKCQ